MLLSYLTLKASELFSKDDGRVYDDYCLSGGHVTLYAGEHQLGREDSLDVGVIEVRFRASQAAHGEMELY